MVQNRKPRCYQLVCRKKVGIVDTHTADQMRTLGAVM